MVVGRWSCPATAAAAKAAWGDMGRHILLEVAASCSTSGRTASWRRPWPRPLRVRWCIVLETVQEK